MKDLDLAEYFITSKAEVFKVNGDEKKIVVSKAEGKKCPRCWKILQTKCIRCDDILSGTNVN